MIFIMALLFWKEGDPFMFIWDFLADKVLGEILDWVYGKLVEFLGPVHIRASTISAK